MNLDFSKIDLSSVGQNFRFAVLSALGSSPKKYWAWFVFFVAILFLTTAAFNFYLSSVLDAHRMPATVDVGEVSGPKINLSGLDEAVKNIEEKEAEFQNIMNKDLTGDPAL